MKRKFLIFLLLLSSFSAKAVSFVYFQNNTSLDLTVSTNSTLGSNYWNETYSGNFEAWKLQTKIFEVNRDQGIVNGNNYYLTTTVASGSESVDLEIKLNGNFIGSDIWHSASGNSFAHAWYSNYSFYSEEFVLNGDTFILTYRSDLPPGNTWADFYYVLQEKTPYPSNIVELLDSNTLNVLSYNIFMLTPPIGSSEEYVRAGFLHKYVKNYDAIILSEAFYNDARNDLIIPLLGQEYPYHSDIVDGSTVEDGGVMIFSRWPIEYEQQFLYTNCDGSDCLSSKGVMYVKINKMGKKYHIFGSHTQAWPDATSTAVRLAQIAELHNFVQSQTIPNSEAIIIGGDLNVNKTTTPSLEFTTMINSLNVEEPAYLGLPYTYNPSYNSYASGSQEHLDYVFYEKDHLCAVEYTNTTKIFRHVEQNSDLWDNNSLDLDLSDHYPVHGRFVFPSIGVFTQNDSICFGEEMLLYVNSNVDLSYQWFRNDTMLIGEQNDTLSSNALNGLYHCEATHGTCATIKSNTVTIFVHEQIQAPIIVRNNNLIEADNDLGIQWYFNNSLMLNENDSFISTCELGIYYSIYSIGSCSSDTSNIIEVISEIPIVSVYGNIAVSSIPNGNQWYNSFGEIINENNDTLILCEDEDYFVLNNLEYCVSDTSNIVSYQNIYTSPIINWESDTIYSSENNGNMWYLDGNLLPNESLNYIVPITSGVYSCASQNNCGILYSNELTFKETGINALVEEITFIYPNPVYGNELNFNFVKILNQSLNFKLFDINGKLIEQQIFNETNISTITVPLGLNGIYFAIIEIENGQKFIQKLRIIN